MAKAVLSDAALVAEASKLVNRIKTEVDWLGHAGMILEKKSEHAKEVKELAKDLHYFAVKMLARYEQRIAESVRDSRKAEGK